MLKKEMAASVTSYVIFISFVVLVVGPGLFSLSFQLLQEAATTNLPFLAAISEVPGTKGTPNPPEPKSHIPARSGTGTAINVLRTGTGRGRLSDRISYALSPEDHG